MGLGLVPKLQKSVCRLPFWPNVIKNWFESPSGPFTVFFWCPAIKVGITISNIGDLKKPTEMISARLQLGKLYFNIIAQNKNFKVLLVSGCIWTRYSFVITPILWNLAGANSLMAGIAAIQLYRKWENGDFKQKDELSQ